MTHYALHWPETPGGETTHRARYLGDLETETGAIEAAGHTPVWFLGDDEEPFLRTEFADLDGILRSWVAEAPTWMTDPDHPERRAGEWLAAGPAPSS